MLKLRRCVNGLMDLMNGCFLWINGQKILLKFTLGNLTSLFEIPAFFFLISSVFHQ
jgi:hypothetical protein